MLLGKNEGSTGTAVLEEHVLYRLKETRQPADYELSDKTYYFLFQTTDDNGNVETDEQTTTAVKTDMGENYFNENNTDILSEVRLFSPEGGDIYVPNEYTSIGVRKVWVDEKGSLVEGKHPVKVQLYQSTRTEDTNDVVTVHVRLEQTGAVATVDYKIGRDSDMSFKLANEWNPDEVAKFTIETKDCKMEISPMESRGAVICNVSDITAKDCYVTIYNSYIGDGLVKEKLSGSDPKIIEPKDKYGEAVELSASSNWKHHWDNLPAVDEKTGEKYYYSVEELNPDPSCRVSYSVEESIETGEIVITNTWLAKETELTVRKVWEDKGIPADHKAIEVDIYKKAVDGGQDSLVKTVTLDDYGDWTAHVTGLEAEANAEYYAVEKTPIEGYEIAYSYQGIEHKIASEVSADLGGVITITNTRKLKDVSVQKKWTTSKEENAEELTDVQLEALGLKDKKLRLHIYGAIIAPDTADKDQYFTNGVLKEEYRLYNGGTIEVSSETGWSGQWTDLPAADEESNLPYYYYVIEETDGFETVYFQNGTTGTPQDTETGNVQAGKPVIVSNVIGKKKITIDKKWFDKTGTDITSADTHPQTVSVQLYRSTVKDKKLSELTDTEKYGDAVTIGSDGWTYTWDNLDWKNETGEVYYYYVKESPVEGYNTNITNNGTIEGTIQIANQEIPTTEISVEKKWLDGQGNAIPNPEVDQIEVEAWRAAIPDYDDEFVEVDVAILKGTSGSDYFWKETLKVRKGTVINMSTQFDGWCWLTVYVDGDTSKDVAYNVASQPSVGSCSLTIMKDTKITGNVNPNGDVNNVTFKKSFDTSKLSPFEKDREWSRKITLSKSNGWKETVKALPKEGVDESGNKITYVYGIKETTVLDGYAVSYSNNEGIVSGTITVTNTAAETEKQHITLKKVWKDKDGNSSEPVKGSVKAKIWRVEDNGTSGKKMLAINIKVGRNNNYLSATGNFEIKDETVVFKIGCEWAQSFNGGFNTTVSGAKIDIKGSNEGVIVCTLTDITGDVNVSMSMNDDKDKWSMVENWITGAEPVGGSTALSEDFITGTDNPPVGAVLVDTVTISGPNWEYGKDLISSITDSNGNTTKYKYYVQETEGGENCITSYENLGLDTDGNILYGVNITNTKQNESYILPETGGTGTTPYTFGGAALAVLAGFLMYIQNKRRKEGQDSS